jgi:hypothetical protein
MSETAMSITSGSENTILSWLLAIRRKLLLSIIDGHQRFQGNGHVGIPLPHEFLFRGFIFISVREVIMTSQHRSNEKYIMFSSYTLNAGTYTSVKAWTTKESTSMYGKLLLESRQAPGERPARSCAILQDSSTNAS